jgi:hypothetical protein
MTYSTTVQHQGGPSSALLLESDIGGVTFLPQAGDGSAEEEKVLDLVFRGLGGQSSDLIVIVRGGNGQRWPAVRDKEECQLT